MLPAVQQDSGAYSGRREGWKDKEPSGGERFVAASFYLALMTATCLDLAGAEGEIVVEGPFASNEPYLSMLAAATARPVARQKVQGTGTSIGAALLAGGPDIVVPNPEFATTSDKTAAMRSYARIWNRAVSAGP